MRKLFAALALAVALPALAGCSTFGNLPTSPSAAADQTLLDERGAIAVESAYQAAGLALESAVDAGVLTGTNAANAAALERRAYNAVLAVRAAYDAGNAADYQAALTTAREAVAAALLAVNGE